MNLQDVYVATARVADTTKQKINVSEVSRVLSQFFSVLNMLPPDEADSIIKQGKRRAAAKTQRMIKKIAADAAVERVKQKRKSRIYGIA